MHGSIRDQLENLLAHGDPAVDRNGAVAHIHSCSECSAEFLAMRETAEQLRKLRAGEELEPSAGFYARVLQRIESRARISEWAAFLYSPFSKRLAYASLSAALILGAYVLTEESRDGHLQSSGIGQSPSVMGSQAEQRDAVIVNFASFEGSPQ